MPATATRIQPVPQGQFQRQTAILHVHGPLLIIAGPGSGKTPAWEKAKNLYDWSSNGHTFRFDKTIQAREAEFGRYPSALKLGAAGAQEAYQKPPFVNFVFTV
mgnify:CR=1 FL=1